MSEKRRVDTSHPDCEEYTKKFKELWAQYYELEEKERAKYPDWKGKDHPADVFLAQVYRKYCEEMKALQQEYSHIFKEADE